MKTTLVLLEIKHKKDLPEVADKVAQRAYTLDGVEDCIVLRAIEEKEPE